ncbi:MAG: hypothetical protein PHP50_07985 [Lachnospiraceae bacterium]|nr:hypothetical protein [Lachnospiraceae bacterium]
MMYIHYCKRCHRIHMLNGHKMNCPRCEERLTELKLSYLDYVNMSLPERDQLVHACEDDSRLKSLSTTYRMYKYSKWYRKLKESERLAVEQSAITPSIVFTTDPQTLNSPVGA